jgi:hypothetical protein
VYFPTRADELAYLNKGLYPEGEISRDISATHSSPSLRDGFGGKAAAEPASGVAGYDASLRDAVPAPESPAALAKRAAEKKAALEQAKTRAAIQQHMRDMQFKWTFYDKDGNVTDVCPWDTPKKKA